MGSQGKAVQGTEDGQVLLSSWETFMVLCSHILAMQLLLPPVGHCFQGQGSAEHNNLPILFLQLRPKGPYPAHRLQALSTCLGSQC